jgi:hypothetical protein
VRACDNFVIQHDDGPHRELVDVEALLGFDQRLGHQFLVAHGRRSSHLDPARAPDARHG